ncbi:hypothetical protein [Skermania piniformis]|uniref:Uncharacterized protein n=1 Tax=Skermania pinensis TaxID=39122 RepID=A0ABX8SDQ2_9ACTN|nr:hypothetical protein [Skermania piniformis]QXQ14565.1 hypothetical protein KV203_03925 [Skermania piniformis]
MSKPRNRRCGRRRQYVNPRRHTPLELRCGDDLAGLPPLPRIAACTTGKLAYADRDTAEATLASMDRRDQRRREQRVYKCPFCGGWHLTSQPYRVGFGDASR